MRTQIAIILIAATSAFAQDKLQLTVEQAIALAFDNSKMIHSSLMKVQHADAKASELGASQFPSLKFSGGYTRLSEVPPFAIGPIPNILPTSIIVSPTVENNYTMRVSLQQPLFTGFKLHNSVRAAELAAEATAQEYNKDRNELVYNVKHAYWLLYKAKHVERFVTEAVEQTKAHLTDVQHMFNQGLVTKNEVLKVQVQLSSTQLQLIDARNAAKLAMVALNNSMGIQLSTEIDLTSDLEHSAEDLPQLDALIAAALENRPDIKAMELRVKASEAGLAAAQGNWYPQLYVVGNYYYARPNQRIFPVKDEFRGTWDVGVAATFDIWNWGSTLHQTNQARAQLEQSKDACGLVRDAITLEVTQAYLNLHQAQEKISVAEQAVAQAEENHRTTVEKFKAGVALNTDVLDAETSLLQAKTNYTQALVDYQLAEAKLEKVIGK